MIRFACPACDFILQATTQQAGTKLNCPKCEQRIQVPAVRKDKTILASALPESTTTTTSSSESVKTVDRTNVEWKIQRAGLPFGPFSFAQLQQLAVAGQLEASDLVIAHGMGQWLLAAKVGGLFPNKSQLFTSGMSRYLPSSSKKRWLFAIAGLVIAFLVGYLATRPSGQKNKSPVLAKGDVVAKGSPTPGIDLTVHEKDKSAPDLKGEPISKVEQPVEKKTRPLGSEIQEELELKKRAAEAKLRKDNLAKMTYSKDDKPALVKAEPEPTKEPTIGVVKKSPPKRQGATILADEMAAAGFGWSEDSVEQFTRFGSKQAADNFARGDQFDRLEIEKEAKQHRSDLRDKRFRLDKLSLLIPRRDDLESKGLIAELILPFRVRSGKPWFKDRLSFSGLLSCMHPAEVNINQFWFLTVDRKIQACTSREAGIVERNNGVLYHPEVGNTNLILVFKGNFDALKDLSRNAQNYSVEIEITNLCRQKPLGWGFYRRDAYIKSNWDCQKLWIDHLELENANNPQPVFFATAWNDTNADQIPEITWCMLLSLKVHDKEGHVVGGYQFSQKVSD